MMRETQQNSHGAVVFFSHVAWYGMVWYGMMVTGIKQLDQRRHPEQSSESRLSWNLDTASTGGWRAGTFIDLGQRPNGWRKLLYVR